MESKKERRKRKAEEMKSCNKKMKTNSSVDKADGNKSDTTDDDNVKILRGLDVCEFAQERANEMNHMLELLKKGEYEKSQRTFQLFPRHMRRRAASHDIRRIPRKFREKARVEESYRLVEAGLDKRSKKPCRKQRRRRKNLVEEYEKRQKSKTWLETHIWHAKRFHMTEKWGYKLPVKSTQRGIKAVYRMTSRGCTVQDISFLKCFELTGKQDTILNGLMQLTSQDTGLTFASKVYLSGSREGRCFLYSKNCYPYQAIGPVRFLWKSDLPDFNDNLEDDDECRNELNGELRQKYLKERKIMIWCHPAIFLQLKTELISVFSSNESSVDKTQTNDNSNNVDDNQNNTEEKIIDSEQEFHFQSRNGISITDISFEVNRIRVTGPCSHSLLKEMLWLGDSFQNVCDQWWNKSKSLCTMASKVNLMWKLCGTLSSVEELPSHVVLCLNVMDPRLTLPNKKQSCFTETTSDEAVDQFREMLLRWPDDASSSQLWDTAVRKLVREKKMTDDYLNKRRSEFITPTRDLGLGDAANRIPVILVQRPGAKGETGKTRPNETVFSGYGSGWDIIFPSGWTMPFWIALIYRGARAIGLEDSDSTHTEALQADLMINLPDTDAGQQELNVCTDGLEKKMLSRPPNKRVNFQRLGISFPYGIPWANIITEWIQLYSFPQFPKLATFENWNLGEEKHKKGFFVLRDRNLLRILGLILTCKVDLRDNYIQELLSQFTKFANALVPVSFKLNNKGHPEYNGLIAVPSKDDMNQITQNLPFAGPEEPLHKGSKLLFRTIADEFSIERSHVSTIGHNTRWTLGHVTNAKYCFSRGKSGGVGLVSYLGLLHLINTQKDIPHVTVLIRNTKSLHYRFADVMVSHIYADIV